MPTDALIVLTILAVAVILFATERLRVDFIALGVMIALILFGIVTPTQGIAGFANQATLTIAAMFVLSAGLQQTGTLDALGDRIARIAGKSEGQLILLLMLASALLSAFVLNTAIVAIFIPIGIKLAHDADIAPSKLLMPISFGAMLGGTITLIGTSTNLLINGIAAQAGLPTFSLFDFAPLGIPLLVVGVLYMLLVGRHLIPNRTPKRTLIDRYDVRKYISEVEVLPGSSLIGKRLIESGLGDRYDITVLDILREGRPIHLPGASRHLRQGDVILMRAPLNDLLEIHQAKGLDILPVRKLSTNIFDDAEDIGLVEVVVATGSSLIGRSLKEVNFRQRFGAVAIGLQRHGTPIYNKLGHATIMAGDMLLVLGRKEVLTKIQQSPDFLLLIDVPLKRKRGNVYWALLIMAGVIGSTLLGWLAILPAALLGAFLMVASGIITLDEAYASLDKRVLVMLGGILALESAMENSGLAQWLAESALAIIDPSQPWLLVGTFYVLSMLLSAAISNQATAVVLAPLALLTAQTLGADPTPLLMAVTFAASASFMTPVGYQTNIMIYGAGNYRFFDFVRVGTPLNLILLILSVVAIPIIWPLW